jgi:Rrf2 family iron-sulfur cluster assembly transcriptional regulator
MHNRAMGNTAKIRKGVNAGNGSHFVRVPQGHTALAIMLEIERRGAGCPISTVEIEALSGTSNSSIEKFVAELRRAGLIKSFRGPGGGYQLAKPAEEISVLDIVLATEGKPPPWRDKGIAAFSKQSPPEDVWEVLERLQHRILCRLPLADIAEDRFKEHPLVKEVFSVVE